ncbi:MAG: hypothetical protein HGA85_02900 [Nanoarchaeota archaeon]|nr:hypothetical protein [Nanoarchaeota archaeon]
MIPGKLKIVCAINIVLGIIMGGLFGFAAIINLLAALENPLFSIISIIYAFVVVGFAMIIFGSVLMLFRQKAGYYLLLVAWVINTPNLTSVAGLIIFLWMALSLDIVRNNLEVREFLSLNEGLLEKSWKKADKKSASPKAGPIHDAIQPKLDVPKKTEAEPAIQESPEDPVIKYVKDCRAKGFSDEQIKAALVSAGHDINSLEPYFKNNLI